MEKVYNALNNESPGKHCANINKESSVRRQHTIWFFSPDYRLSYLFLYALSYLCLSSGKFSLYTLDYILETSTVSYKAGLSFSICYSTFSDYIRFTWLTYRQSCNSDKVKIVFSLWWVRNMIIVNTCINYLVFTHLDAHVYTFINYEVFVRVRAIFIENS